MKQHHTPHISDSRTPGRPLTRWIGVFILLLGAILRLTAFDETLILEDQSAILDAAFQVAHLRYFPVVGMKSSAGVMQTGIVPLLAAIPLFFVKRIIAVQWFLSALDLLSLAWLYRAVRKAVGIRAAGIVALLYATAPWVVLYARTIWYQTLLASLATVTFACILLLLTEVKVKPGVMVLSMVSTTLMSMVHLAAAPWGVLLFVFCAVIARKQKLGRGFGWGLGISIALVLPYFIYLIRSSFADVAFILKTGGASQGLNTAAYRLSKELISGAMIVANAHGDLWDKSVLNWNSASGILLTILFMSVLWAGYRIITNRRLRPMLLLSVVWLFAVPTLFLRSNVHLQHFYLMTIFPAPFVLIGMWIESFWRTSSGTRASKLRRTVGYFISGVLILISLWWSSLWIVRIRLESHGLLERPTRGWLMDWTADVIARYLREQPGGQVIAITGYSGEMSTFEWLRGYAQTDAVRIAAAGQGLIIPAGPTCYLLGPQVSLETIAPVADLVTARPDLDIPANPPWHFYCFVTPTERPVPLAQWENGLGLLDTEVAGEFRPGQKLDIAHTWVYSAKAPGDYHFFNHLLLDGELVAQVDGAGIPSWYWRNGDVLLTHFSLQLPDFLSEGEYTLRTGLYTWPELQRVHRVTGEDGYQVLTLFNP